MRIVVALGMIFALVLVVGSGLLKVLRELFGESSHPAPTLSDSIVESGFTRSEATFSPNESGFSQSR